MNNMKTLAQSQMTVMVAPTVEAELRRMAREAQMAFDRDDSSEYIGYEVQADLAQHVGLDAAQREYRYYLWVHKHNDAATGLPFAAVYAVNVYGTIAAEKCIYGVRGVASLMQTFGNCLKKAVCCV